MTRPELSLSAATAFAPDRFCIAHFEGDDEDPLSIVLSYDGRFPQPWNRTDIARRIVGIEAASENETGVVYVAISDEGDVYKIDGNSVSVEKIPGAGIYSEDALYGNINGLTQQNDMLWAFGFGGQVHQGDDRWRRVTARYDEFDISEIRSGHFGENGVGWFCGSVAPPLISKDYRTDQDLQKRIAEAEDDETYLRLMDELGRQMRGDAPSAPTPLLLSYQNNRLNRAEIHAPDTGIVLDVFIERPNRIWAVGSEGMIIYGNADSGFSPVPHAGAISANLYGITQFRDRFVIIGDSGLFDFDGHILTRIRPRLSSPDINHNTPVPWKVQSLGHIMMYFDYRHGVCRWDGEIWDWVNIPDALLKREFEGLE